MRLVRLNLQNHSHMVQYSKINLACNLDIANYPFNIAFPRHCDLLNIHNLNVPPFPFKEQHSYHRKHKERHYKTKI